jgi:M6 family metalloprotease-like protein
LIKLFKRAIIHTNVEDLIEIAKIARFIKKLFLPYQLEIKTKIKMNKAIKIIGILSFSLLFVTAGLFNNVNNSQAHGDDELQAQSVNIKVLPPSADVTRANTDLNTDLATYSKATTANKAKALNTLVATAQSRKEKMINEARINPAGFLKSVIPAATFNKLPKEVQAQTEQGIQVEGKLRVVHFDGLNGKDLPNRYELTDSKTKKTYNLDFGKGGIPTSKNGSVVKASGIYLDTDIVISDAEAQALGTGLTYIQSAPIAPTSVGPQNTLVMLVGFTDTPAVKPYTQAQIEDAMFTGTYSANKYYQEVSYGQVSFTGDVTPWLNVPFSGADCAVAAGSDVATAALNAASAQGYNLNNYSRYVYYIPSHSCLAAGGASGNMLSVFQTNWGGNSFFQSTLVHELGHSLNLAVLGHAGSIDCGTKAIDVYVACQFSEYGDYFDVMGVGNFSMNGIHRILLSWIPSTRIQSVTTSGTYTVSPLESPSGLQILKIAKPDTGAFYYLEYRQPIGLDSTLPSGITSGAEIIVDPTPIFNDTGRIDTTPGDHSQDNSALSDNASFVDPINGITVKQLSHNSAGATLQVTFNSGPCKVSPTVTASPTSQNGSINQYLTYNVTVKNNDGSSCPNTNFGISMNSTGTQAGLKLETTSQTGDLVPGASITSVVRIASTNAYNQSAFTTGDLNFALTAKDLIDSSHVADSPNLIYNVVAGCYRHYPTINVSNPAQSGARGATLKYNAVVTNTDSGNCPSATFKVYGQADPTWTFSNPVSIPLAPGASASTQISVTSPMSAVATTNLGIFAEDKDTQYHNVGVSVTYTITGLTCTPSPATMTIANPNLNGYAGQTLDFDLKVTSHDSIECEAVPMKLELAGLPAGFTTPYNATTVLPAGISNTPLSQSVTSPSNAVKQTNNFTIYLTNTVTNTHIASVPVSYTVTGNPSCSVHAISSTVVPVSQVGSKGQPLTYAVTINNNDALDCPDTTFIVGSNNLPSGFTANPVNKIIAPGTSGIVNFVVTSSSNTAPGNYNFDINISGGSNPLHTSTLSATYQVSGTASCVGSKPTLTITPSSNLGTPGLNVLYTLSVTNNDLYSCADATFKIDISPNSFALVYSGVTNMTLSPGATDSTFVNVVAHAGTTGTHQFTVNTSESSEPLHTASISATYVTKTDADCQKYTPSVILSPVSLTGSAGQTFNYIATVKNNDTQACGNSTFGVYIPLLNYGFVSSENEATIAPGSTSAIPVSITVPADASDSTINFAVRVSDVATFEHTVLVAGTMIISNSQICTRSAPTISLSPISQTGQAGQALPYNVTVTNKDSSGCANAAFGISTSGMPTGFTSSSPSTASLAPGASGTIALSVTASSSATNGTNPFTVIANDASVSGHSASTAAAYVVSNPVVCTRAVPTISLSPIVNTGYAGDPLPYTATVYNNDSSSCASSTFNITTSVRPGDTSTVSPASVIISAGSTKSISVSIIAHMSDTFTITASDNSISNHNASTQGEYAVYLAACTRSAPTISLSPTSRTGTSGSTQSYTATVKNNDGPSCASTTFNLSSSLPSGFTASFSPSSLTLVAGSTNSTTISVKSPSSASNSTYSFTITSNDGTVSGHSASTSGSYIVSNAATCVRQDPTVTVSPTSQNAASFQILNYTVTVKNNDPAACNNPVERQFAINTSSTPGYANYSYTTVSIASGATGSAVLTLNPGRSQPVNGTNNFTITASDNYGSDSASARYVVGGGTPTCTRSAPTISLSPTSQAGSAGTSQYYSASIINNDSTSCASTAFSLSTSSLPSGFTGSFSPTSVAVSAGNTGSATVTITSPSNATSGSKSFTVKATDNSISGHSDSATGSYVVSNQSSCSRQNPTITVSPSSQSIAAYDTIYYAVSVTNNDSPSCSFNPSYRQFTVSPSSVAGYYGSTAAITVGPGATGSDQISFYPSRQAPTSGSYSFTITANDNYGNSNTTGTFTVGNVLGDVTNVPSNSLDTNSSHTTGTLIKIDNTYYVVVGGGLIGIPSLEVLQSWGYSLSQAIDGNSTDRELFQIKVLSLKQPGQVQPWD